MSEQIRIPRTCEIALCLIVCMLSTPLAVRQAGAGEFDFLPDQPGTAEAVIEDHNLPRYGLDSAAGADYRKNLKRVYDQILAQPALQPPLGVRVKGYFRASEQSRFPQAGPVPGYGHLLFYPCYRDPETKQPTYWAFTTTEIVPYVNNSVGGLTALTCSECDTRMYYEPQRTGEIGGYPLYRGELGSEYLVLSRARTAPWAPITREEFVNIWLRYWEGVVAKAPPQDTVTPQVVEQHREALAAMSPQERQMQARYQGQENPFAPMLAPVGSDQGIPLVKPGEGWIDPALSRSTIQLVMVKFWYSGELDPDKPEPDGTSPVSARRMWEVLHRGDWAAVGTALGL